MRLRNIGFGILVVAISLLIGLYVTQLGRFPSNAGAMPDVKVTQPTEETENKEVFVEDSNAPAMMERLLYIGELRGCGLRDDARFPRTDYFCAAEMTVFNLWEMSLSDDEFCQRTLEALLAEREYSCVIVALGLNEAGYPLEQLRQGFGDLVAGLIRTQPQARIIIQGVLAVGRDWVARADYTSPERLGSINGLLRQLAAQYHVEFIDVNEKFADKQGYLPCEMSPDGCYLYSEYNEVFVEFMLEKLE